jgi:tetratricopeptide (TPR) repeat protein
MEFHKQALAISREISDRHGEGRHLDNLGVCDRDLADYRRAMEFHEQALAISREISDRVGEGISLGNLGVCHYALGDYRRAVDLNELALAIAREISDRCQEASELGYLGDARRELREWAQAQLAYDEAIAIADSTANLESQVDPRCGLAEMHLRAGDVDAASDVVARLNNLNYPPRRGIIQLVRGFIYLQSGDAKIAHEAFSASIGLADNRLEVAEREVESWDVKGLAHAGLAVLGDEASVSESLGAFHRARAIAMEPGLVARVAALLDLLTPYDIAHHLDFLRQAATGR